MHDHDHKSFMLIIFGNGEEMATLSKKELDTHMGKWHAWTEELKEKGFYGSGDPVRPEATVISGKDMKVSEGYFVDDPKYAIGGYYILTNLHSMEEAVEVSKGCPTFELDGDVELREIMTIM